ncbi:hypothetical protein JYK22_31310, partial [Nonomuraea sp. RK-328]|nr:hypothetical protein [Nonomuraea sp. RK-328]
MALPEDERPKKPWPGLEARPDEIKFEAKVLEGIAKDLEADLKRLLGTGAGTPTDFAKHADPTASYAFQIDPDYAPGVAFRETLSNGKLYFGTVYQEIIEKYTTAINLLYAGAGVQKQVEATNTRLV